MANTRRPSRFLLSTPLVKVSPRLWTSSFLVPPNKSWYTLMALSCSLFSVIFHRLHSKQQAFFGMKPDPSRGHFVRSRSIVAQNAQGVYHLFWTLFPVVFSRRDYPSSTRARSRISMEESSHTHGNGSHSGLSKLLQMNITMDVHSGVFDYP